MQLKTYIKRVSLEVNLYVYSGSFALCISYNNNDYNKDSIYICCAIFC